MIKIYVKDDKLQVVKLLFLIILNLFLSNSSVSALNEKISTQQVLEHSQSLLDETKILESPPSFRLENFKLSFFLCLLVTTSGLLLLTIKLLFLKGKK